MQTHDAGRARPSARPGRSIAWPPPRLEQRHGRGRRPPPSPPTGRRDPSRLVGLRRRAPAWPSASGAEISAPLRAAAIRSGCFSATAPSALVAESTASRSTASAWSNSSASGIASKVALRPGSLSSGADSRSSRAAVSRWRLTSPSARLRAHRPGQPLPARGRNPAAGAWTRCCPGNAWPCRATGALRRRSPCRPRAAGRSPSSRSTRSAMKSAWLTTTTSASCAWRRALTTKQSRMRGHSWPRQFSRVEVTRCQISAFGYLRQIAPVAGLGDAGEHLDLAQLRDLGTRFQGALVALHAVQVIVADIVAAPLEQRGRHRRGQRAHARQIARKQLVLQRAGACGNQHLAALDEGGYKVGPGLADAGAGLGDERGAVLDGLADGLRQLDLRGARLSRAWPRPAARPRRRIPDMSRSSIDAA